MELREPPPPPRAGVDALFDSIDEDKSGEIEYVEFIRFMVQAEGTTFQTMRKESGRARVGFKRKEGRSSKRGLGGIRRARHAPALPSSVPFCSGSNCALAP